jgi:CelD/BcsL family acetyltransferase involved in cellulose biosynthesis
MTLESPTSVEGEIETIEEWSAYVPTWRQLLDETDHSVFLTVPWIETWLETYSDVVDPALLVLRSGGRVIGAGLMVKSGSSLARPLHRISLNASGESAADSTYVEFNNVLASPGWEKVAGEALVRYALGRPWEEFSLDGFCPGPAYDAMKRSLSGTRLEEINRLSYYVDLSALRAADLRYLAAVGASHRKHLQQNLRYHAERGEVVLQAASDTASALNMFEELAALNRRRRETLGRPSVFSSERFVSFHRSFIRKTFPLGTVQLLRVMAGSNTVGLVYNLVHRGKVYFYQCGYNYTADRRLSPGTVSLALVIQYCLDRGFLEFDFLAGEAPYKASLSTGSRSLVWATFRRPGPRVWAYGVARGLKNRFRSYSGSQA